MGECGCVFGMRRCVAMEPRARVTSTCARAKGGGGITRRTAGWSALLAWTSSERKGSAQPKGGPYYQDGRAVGRVDEDARREYGKRIKPIDRMNMRKDIVLLVQEKVMEHVEPDARHPQLLRLAAADATTYRFGAPKNIGGPAGGANGSVAVFEEEKNLLVEAGLGDVLQQLVKAKEEVDRTWKERAQQNQALQTPTDISWADMIALAAQTGVMEAWNKTNQGDEKPMEEPFTTRQGRIDRPGVEPYQRMPQWALSPTPANATAAREWLHGNGFSDAQAAALIAELCGGLDAGLDTLRGDPVLAKNATAFQKNQVAYRQAFQEGFVRMTSLGSSFDPYAYLYDLK